ncbi:kinase-like protein [Hortaea werneckii]|nr:kinase-like protein [Hortaea werneckii]
MAATDAENSNSKVPHDEEHDIASGASTPPPGTATPRPDFADKRLPGIVSSFFQVRSDSLSRKRSKSSAQPSPAPPSAPSASEDRSKEQEAVDGPHPQMAGGAPPPTAPSSPLGDTPESMESPPLLPHEKPHAEHLGQSIYPTPPLSSSSSLLNMSDELRSAGGNASVPVSRKASLERKKTASLSSSLRRHTLSNAISKPQVSAHISNPANDAAPSDAFASTSAAATANPSSPRHTEDKQEKQALTQGAERSQNTPPQTPRSGSYVSRQGEDGRHVPRESKTSRSSSANHPAIATVGAQKGQLEITVEEGRGLRPSVEPYVVCIFQQNEDVSGGPQEDDEMDTAVDNESVPEESLAKGVAMKRMGSGSGQPMAIPGMGRRQTSQTNIADLRRGSTKPEVETTNPCWRHTATFDVVGENNEVDVTVYDRKNGEAFLGHVRLPINLDDFEHQHEDWYKLSARKHDTLTVTGEVRLRIAYHPSGKKIYGPDDFEVLKLIGKGTFGQVFQVRKKDTKRIYAMKVLSKKVIVQKKEIQHTIGERNILVRTATTESPFIVGLKFSFQTAADLYLVTDYMSGGELFWHLQKEGRFIEERAKFYIAELILSLRHLHQHDIVYRDLKPENILLDANGHIALCDFGLSKANLSQGDTTNTFCGTTEYLAPEVLLDEQGYTKMVDFWSLGVLVFEMCCGWSPFYAEDTQQMYKNIAFGKVRFPRDALSQEGRNFVKGLLNRNPAHRLGAKGDAEELMQHPFFHDIDWQALSKKTTQPPFKPKLKGELDTSNFDPEFTNALSSDNPSSSLNARAAQLASGVGNDGTPLSPTMQNQFKGFTFVDESTLEQQFEGRDVGGAENAAPGKTSGEKRADRMSGIEQQQQQQGQPTSTDPNTEFNHGMLEDI